MRRLCCAIALLLLAPCSGAMAETIWFTPGDIGPSNPTTMTLGRAGRLMPRADSYVYSNVAIPYPASLRTATEMTVTVYFIPDAPTAGNVDFKIWVQSRNVGEEWNYGGVVVPDAPALPVAGSGSVIYSQSYRITMLPAPKDLLEFGIGRDTYGTDTYPTGVYLHAVKIDITGTAAIGENQDRPSAPELTLRPNPFLGQVAIDYTMPNTGSATFQIHDVQGRLVQEIHRGVEAPGAHTFTWTGPRGGKGVFFVRMLLNGTATSARAVKLE